MKAMITDDDITDEELAAGLALCEAATPGPWYVDDDRKASPRYGKLAVCSGEGPLVHVAWGSKADAAFIAWCGTHVGRLLAALAKARRERDEARDAFAVSHGVIVIREARIAEVERERDAAIADQRNTGEQMYRESLVSEQRRIALDASVKSSAAKDARIAALEAVARMARHEVTCGQAPWRGDGYQKPSGRECTCGLAEKRKAAGL